jgi:hypothetical protein
MRAGRSQRAAQGTLGLFYTLCGAAQGGEADCVSPLPPLLATSAPSRLPPRDRRVTAT